MLKSVFINLVKKYTPDTKLANNLWNEIVIEYSDAGRFYHTLKHLENVYNELQPVKDKIADWDVLLFALFYHDIVYKNSQSDNEVESAEIAKNRLKSINFPDEKISLCILHILSTKSHSLSQEPDTNYLNDADLAILGQSETIYSVYAQNIRKEYFLYSDTSYNRGRKAVLKHYINMQQIFKTNFFYEKYEDQARININNELARL